MPLKKNGKIATNFSAVDNSRNALEYPVEEAKALIG